MPGRKLRRSEKLRARAEEALPASRRRSYEDLSDWDKRLHELIGDLSFVVPGEWTPEEAAFVDGNPEVKKLINQYLDTPPEGSYREPMP